MRSISGVVVRLCESPDKVEVGQSPEEESLSLDIVLVLLRSLYIVKSRDSGVG